MSPEQWGIAPVDPRTDLWAVGIMLYEMVTGRHPLDGVPPERIGKEVMDLTTPMPSVQTLLPRLGELGSVIDRCLAKRPEDRIESAQVLLRELESLGPRRRGVSAGMIVMAGVGAVAIAASFGAAWTARADRPFSGPAAAAAPLRKATLQSPSSQTTVPPSLQPSAETPPAEPSATGSLPGPKSVRLGSVGLAPKAPPHAAAKVPRPAANTHKPAGASADGLFDRE